MAGKSTRDGNKDMAAILEVIKTFKQDMADKMADLQEQIEQADMGGKAKLRMVELLYNTA